MQTILIPLSDPLFWQGILVSVVGMVVLAGAALLPLGAAWVVCRVLTSILHASIEADRRG